MATLTSPNTYIDSLINAGADHQTNLYYIEINTNLTDSDDNLKTALKVRNANFNFSGFTQPTYSVHYMTTSVNLPSATFSGEKSFTLQFRIDANYDTYKALLNQQARTSIGNLAFAAGDIPDYSEGGMDITVYALTEPLTDSPPVDPTELEGFKKLYHFKRCWISQLSPLSYNYNGSTALTVTATIRFQDMEDVQNLARA